MLAVWLGMDPQRPLVVAANRDESYSRPTAAPSELKPGVLAGQDLVGGGTWLGINQHGLFAAVTNRRSPPPTPTSRSRGLLALETLNCRKLPCVEGVVERRVRDHPVAGFNLVAIVHGQGLCLEHDGALRRAPFGSGVHVVSSDRDLDDPAMPEKQCLDRFVAAHPGVPDADALRSFLSSHEGERPVCKHGDGYGTVSSTILIDDGKSTRMLYAAGPPCLTPFREVPGTFGR
ncbi:MAG TPA: NRDE family protein [Planctomycetota bacterium]|nr:NRDE family protein [Planctomycetota bacterium]